MLCRKHHDLIHSTRYNLRKTGMRSYYGKEIYEGDRVQTVDGPRWQKPGDPTITVVWNEKLECWSLQHGEVMDDFPIEAPHRLVVLSRWHNQSNYASQVHQPFGDTSGVRGRDH